MSRYGDMVGASSALAELHALAQTQRNKVAKEKQAAATKSRWKWTLGAIGVLISGFVGYKLWKRKK